MKIIKILSLICFLWIGISAQTNAKVSGQLSENDGAISNTKIKLVSLSNKKNELTTTTDKNGKFEFENVADGNYLFIYTDFNGNEQRQVVNITNGELFFLG